MANANANFNLNIKTKVDSAELNRLKQQLREIQQMATNTDMTKGMNPAQIQQMVAAARQLDSALTAAFDVDLNAINVQKFNDHLKKSGTNLQKIQQGLYNAGASGKAAFAQSTAQLLKFNTSAKQTNVFLDKMATTMANTIRWNITSSILNTITGTVRKAYGYVKDLDSGLNDIRIVTGKSADEMERFAEQANEAAKALATTTTDYVEGALIYYQQGLDDETVATLTDITAKTSNVTGQGMDTVSEQLTAVWNGYQVANQAAREGMQVYEEYVDKMAAVGATTASNLEELATAMSKVASAASSMGVGFDELNAQIATIVSVTRQAPESIGTALKTIYARLGDLKIDGVDEFGTSLGDVSGQLQMMGIDVVDMNGDMRDMDDVMTDVAEKWNTWTDAQRQAAAVAMAGKRQYNNLIALFDNWDMYTETLETAQNAAGTLDKQQSIALDSLKNKLDILKATSEDLYDSLFDEESLKDLVDGIIPVVQGLANMADAVGGLNTLLPALGSIGVQVFSKHLANGLSTFRHNLLMSIDTTYKQNQAIQELADKYKQLNFKNTAGIVDPAQKAIITEMIQYTESMLDKRKLMTQEEQAYYNKILDEKAVLADQVALLTQAKENYAQNKNAQSLFGVNPPSTEKIEKYSTALAVLENQIKTTQNKKGTIPAPDVKDAITAVESFEKELRDLKVSDEVLKTFTEKFKDFQAATTKNGGISVKGVRELLSYLKQFPEAAGAVDKLEREVKELDERVKGMQSNLNQTLNFKAIVDSTMKTIGALGQLASSIQTIKNLGSIWKNEDLETGEKVLQTIINVSFAIPMLLTAIKTLNSELGISSFLSAAFALHQTKSAVAAGGGAAATSALAFAQDTYNKVLLASPLAPYILALTGLMVVVGGAIALYDIFTISAEEASEALTESIAKYNETKTELENLETELENCTNRLKELYAIADEDLTIADKQEIATLEAQNALLAAQIELKKQQLNLDQKEIVKSGITALEKGSFKIKDNSLFGINNVDSVTEQQSDVIKAWVEQQGLYDENGNLNFNLSDSKEVQKFIDNIQLELDKNKNSGSNFITIAGSEISKSMAQDLIKDLEEKQRLYNDKLIEVSGQILDEGTLAAFYAQNTNGQYDEKIAQLEGIMKEYYKASGELGSIAEKILNSTFSTQEELNAILNSALDIETETVDENVFIDTLNQMGIDGQEVFNNLKISAQTLGLSMYDLLQAGEDYGIQIFNEKSAKSIYDVSLEKITLLKDALEKLNKGTALTAEEITTLESKYEELSKIWDKSSQEYIQALNDVLDAEEQSTKNQLKENAGVIWTKASEALQKYDEELNHILDNAPKYFINDADKMENALSDSIEEVDIALKELFENEYQLQISITDDIVSDAENIANMAENAAMAISKIGEGFKVAAEDADALFAVFPELASQAKVLADGTIQLNSTVVDNTLSGYADIIDGDKEVVIENINNRIQELEAKKITVKGQIEAVQDSTDIMADLNNILGENSEGWAQYEAKLSEDLAKDEVYNSGQSAKAVIENWAAKQQAAIDYAETAAAAERPPHDTSGTPKIEGGNYNIRTSADTQNATGENVSDDVIAQTEEELRNNVLDYLNNLYDSYDAQIADLIVNKSKVYNTTDGIKKAADASGDKIKEIYDRYWTINKALEEIEHTLEDLDEIQSHLHGKALIESLEKENKLLEEQEETYNRLYEAQKIEATELRGKLSQYGVMFQDGNVVNYDVAVKGLNASQYEAFQELFERYDELFYSEMVDTLNKIEEINYERLANELEAFEVQLELNLETTEAERALDEFTQELNKDFKSVYENFDEELKHIVDSYNTYIRKNGTIDSIISAIQTVQKEIDALKDNDDTTDSTMFATVGDAQEKLKELQEQLQDATLESRDLMKEYWDTYLDSIDQAAEKFEELSEEFDAINDELDYQRELIELIYGPEAYGMQKQIFDAQINNSLAQVDSARQQVDLWQSYYDQAEEGTEEQLKYAELLKDAQAELNDLTLEHIQLLKDDYANTMDDILTKLEKDITGGLGLDDMKEEWEEAVKESEKYYDNIERIFELETLENKFQNAIDNTASPKYQQAIKDLMEDQLATLKDKEQLTEYDVQLAEKRLGILQAEAALEDAQNAKNAMKLVRGVSGNWEYQYVADTSDIENKQQALRESYQELYEFAKDAQLDSIEALMEAKDDYITKLHEIKDDETLSEEEKLIKIAEINDKYWNEEEGIITKLQQDYYNKTQTLSTASAESLLGLYKADESAYYDMTEYEKGLVDEFKHHAETLYTDMYLAIQEEYKQDQEKFDSYVDSNLLHWQTAASDMAAAWNGDEDSIRTNVNEAYESISDATTEYSLELERLEATSGDSFGEEGITGDINTAIDYTNTLKTKTEELVTLANQKLPEYKTQIENIGIAWSDVADKIDNASKQLKYYLELSEIEVPEPTASGDGSGSVGSGNNSGAGSTNENTPNRVPDTPSTIPTPEPTIYKTIQDIDLFKNERLTPSSRTPNAIKENTEIAILGKNTMGTGYKVDVFPYDGNISVNGYITEYAFNNEINKKPVKKFDTGGYTGDWSGGEGRMAMLHSKELVLNKVDTENILNAVSAVRDMAGITSSVGSAIMQNIKAMIMEVLGISAGTGRATRNTNNETSNVFHITAEFPNANSVETIQEAILSLPNIASQYVAENRR